jgi:5-methylcytosine-specific restriction endonuclease McrA
MSEISLPPKRTMPLRKLTPDQVAEAVRRYEAGEALAPIAAAMEVSRQAMWDLLRRRTKIRDRLAALPRKEPNAVRRHRDINRLRYRLRAARITAGQMMTVRARDQVCRMCGSDGTDFDHILAVALGGQTEMANLQLLCHPCHVLKSSDDRKLAWAWRKALTSFTAAFHVSRSQLPESD